MHPLLNIAENAARTAGKLILKASERLDKVKIIENSPFDFITEVDMVAAQEIARAIQTAYPDHQVVNKESGKSAAEYESVWIIDALVGTTNFIHGVPHYAISIAYQNQGKLEHGLVFDPLRDEMFCASRGRGAKLNNTRIRVSDTQRLEYGLIATGLPKKPTETSDLYWKLFTKVFSKTSGMRRTGSTALDLAYVSAGRFDGFWEMNANIGDFAAGSLLIKEAGGMIGDFDGSENFMTSGNIVAGNVKLFKSLLQQITPEVTQTS